MHVTRAVVLAAGQGTRMRLADPGVTLAPDQTKAADAGVKGMISFGRPFLDYLISALADAGITDVCLVTGPEHVQVRNYYGGLARLERVRIHFANQELPRGTADAVLAAKAFAGDSSFLVVNSDNYYPVRALRALCELGEAGLAAFDSEALIHMGNVPAERVARFAVVELSNEGTLLRISEKPEAQSLAAAGRPVFVSMNCWCFPPGIFSACQSIPPSERGELELPAAVQYAIDRLGIHFRALTFRDAVLDLSSRADIAAVSERLKHLTPRL